MLRTHLCDVLGIELPVIGAPYGPFEQVDLAAAVSGAGALGSLGTAVRPLTDLRRQWARMRELTDRPFAVNHTLRPLNEEAFQATLEEHPACISFHLGVPDDLIERAHDAGILWIQQVMDVRQAEQAVRAGADVVVAQGGEAGGQGGEVATMVLVPQVVDIAGGTPVVAAGGIADGRGLAAALALGAQGVAIGTRLLASAEMDIAEEWKDRIVRAEARDTVKLAHSDRFMPPFSRPGAYGFPRSLRTPFVEEAEEHPERVRPDEAGPRLVEAMLTGRGHEFLPFTGQSAALVHDVLPAAEIVRRIVDDAEIILRRTADACTATGGRPGPGGSASS
ncbi:2-nitropropane dioxygenase [Streptomyces sp. NRRL B-1140]|uniref:NAD(P)H-dependent flavin oxidoreductase n=1 Tax=Streptomyces sp. NRRL B-1140 TaxID=1415549 RepID=UPI0006AEA741|nr:nitronate monooxygenase [Streptomyces sp. NRRL B-1140]KOX03425.1 2-nitropropane dioxygenase [Streptomyces sp. NRRL B-1140]